MNAIRRGGIFAFTALRNRAQAGFCGARVMILPDGRLAELGCCWETGAFFESDNGRFHLNR